MVKALDVFRNRVTAINIDDTNDRIIITVNIYYSLYNNSVMYQNAFHEHSF